MPFGVYAGLQLHDPSLWMPEQWLVQTNIQLFSRPLPLTVHLATRLQCSGLRSRGHSQVNYRLSAAEESSDITRGS